MPELETIRTDRDWVAVHKRPDQLVHPTRPDGVRTLLDEVREAFPRQHLSIVNRLDRETSGIVLFARGEEAASALGKMTMNRQFEKRYVAIVDGTTEPEGTIDAPIDRIGAHGESRIWVKRAVIAGGSPSVTHYRTIESGVHSPGREVSLVELQLATGRLHQIRVHLSHIGHPVIGDKLYGPDDQCYLNCVESGWSDDMLDILLTRRHLLHAYFMAFEWGSRHVTLQAPWPEDFRGFWEGNTNVLHR